MYGKNTSSVWLEILKTLFWRFCSVSACICASDFFSVFNFNHTMSCICIYGSVCTYNFHEYLVDYVHIYIYMNQSSKHVPGKNIKWFQLFSIFWAVFVSKCTQPRLLFVWDIIACVWPQHAGSQKQNLGKECRSTKITWWNLLSLTPVWSFGTFSIGDCIHPTDFHCEVLSSVLHSCNVHIKVHFCLSSIYLCLVLSLLI